MTVKGTDISMVRGDTESIRVGFKGIELMPGDKIEFTVREDALSPVVIHKVVERFENNAAFIYIESQDTAKLSFGDYYYDIQLTHGGGRISTIVKKSKFRLEEEITYE